MGLAGTVAMSGIVLVWALWLAGRAGLSRWWRLLPLTVLPAVVVPATLAAFTDPVLGDVAHGVLFSFAALVSVGTLFHAGRTAQPEG